jgi:hypothetical protein
VSEPHDWQRVDAIEDDVGRPWPVLGVLLIAIVCGALWAAWPKVDGDSDQFRREETRQLVLRAHQRMRADSLATLATREHRTAETLRGRYVAARDSLARWHGLDTVTLAALPVIRGGWGGVVLATDTLPTPRVVVTMLRERDAVIGRADSVIHQYRIVTAKYTLAIPAYQAALAHGDSAMAAKDARHDAELRREQRQRWKWTVIGLVLGEIGRRILGG